MADDAASMAEPKNELTTDKPNVRAVPGNDTPRLIARELVETVHRNVTIDWTLKESVRARLRVIVKRVLRKHGDGAAGRAAVGVLVRTARSVDVRCTSQDLSTGQFESLLEPLQVARDNGAKRALIPIENKRNFLNVSADIMEHLDPIFFGDPKTAPMKVLGA